MYYLASKMKLFKGYEEEYKKRHDQLWPSLVALLTSSGIEQYHIFLDEETNILFAILQTEDPSRQLGLADHPVMKEWWNYMKDIMETNEDHSPVNIPLTKDFSLM